MRFYRLLFVLLVYFTSEITAQSPFIVTYSFDTDTSGVLTDGVGVVAINAIAGGSKLGASALVNDSGTLAWTAQVINNNATNYTNTFIRLDIYPPSGSGIFINQVVAKQRSNGINNNNLFRIGCTLNGATPVNSNTDQSTQNTLFTDVYSSETFSPGNTVNYADGANFISVFLCARDSNTTTFDWYIDNIEISGFVLNTPTPLAVVNSSKKQLIEVMGGDMERSSDFIQKANNTQEILEWFINDIDYNYFRVRYDKKQELTEGVKNWSFYNNQVITMKTIRQLNPNIKFLATMRSDYNGFKTENHNNLPVFIYNYECTAEDSNGNCISTTGDRSFDTDKYGVFLADYIEFMYNEGVPIDFIATAKEWQSVVTFQRSHDTYIKMSSELVNRGIPIPKVIGPATWDINSGINYVNNVIDNNYTDEYESFSTHDLGNTPQLWGDFVNVANNGGKIAFDDESGTAAGGRTSGVEPTDLDELLQAYHEKSLMYNAGIKGEIFFEIWSRGVNTETRSVYFTNGQNGKRMRSYYVMKDFANSAVNKHYCKSTIAFAPNVSSMVFRDDFVVSLWLINESNNAYNDVYLEIPNETMYGSIRQRFWNDPLQSEPFEASLTNSNNGSSSVLVNLSPKSINYFTIAIDPAAILGIESKHQSQLKIYPNPSKDFITIDGTLAFNLPFTLYSISGVKIKEGILKNGQHITTSTLSAGMYFIRLGQQIFKFVKL